MRQSPGDEGSHLAAGDGAGGLVVEVQRRLGVVLYRGGAGTPGDAQLVDGGYLGTASVGKLVVGPRPRARLAQQDCAAGVLRHGRYGFDQQPDQERRHLDPGDVVVGPEGATGGNHPVGGEPVDGVLGLLPGGGDVAEASLAGVTEVYSSGRGGTGDEHGHLGASHVLVGGERKAVTGALGDPVVGDTVDGIAKHMAL